MLAETLLGLVNLMQNLPLRSQQLPDPRLFGLNDSFSVLEAACTSIFNGRGLDLSILPPLRKWLASVADITVLQQFFSIPKPAVAAMWDTLVRTYVTDQSAYSILIEVAARVHPDKWLHCNRKRFLGNAIMLGDQNTAERIIDAGQISAGILEPRFFYYGPVPSADSVPLLVRLCSKLHAPPKFLDTALSALFWTVGSSQAAAVYWLVEEGTKIQPAISDWIPSCVQLLPPDWKPAWVPDALLPVHLGEVFDGYDARKPSCKDILGTFLPFLGILASAKSGRGALRRFVSSLSPDGPPERENLLRLALTETTRQHDLEATKLLLDTCVSLNMDLFYERQRMRNPFLHPDPVTWSAKALDTEMLQLLLNHALFENYPVSRILLEMSVYGISFREVKARFIVDFLLEREGSDLKDIWDELCDSQFSSARQYIVDYVQRRVSHQRTSLLEHRNLLCTIFPDDTLRETIKHDFDLNTIESLATGIHIPSDTTGEENTLLIDALLARSEDRYKIVHFLLRNGADPRVSSPKFTVLEASLYGDQRHKLFRDDRKVNLELFRELSRLGAPFKRAKAPITPRHPPLLTLLIQNHAEISLLQQAVSAGDQVNEYSTHLDWSSLMTAINSRQLDTVKWLLEQGADIQQGVDYSPLGRPDKAQPLIRGLTPLMQAVESSDMDMVILLLSYGAMINVSSDYYMKIGVSTGFLNAVDLAARGNLDILKVLIDSGGQSAYPGLTGLDGAFWEANRLALPGTIMLLEQHTGCSVEKIIESTEKKLQSGEPW